MKRANIIINAFIPVLWIIMFFMIKYDIGRLDYGTIYIFLWFAIPIIMFIINTFSEIHLKRLVLLYLISAGLQVLGVLIEGVLYYNFIGSDPETSAVVWLSIIIVTILNLILSLIGIAIKGLILRFKKHESSFDFIQTSLDKIVSKANHLVKQTGV